MNCIPMSEKYLDQAVELSYDKYVRARRQSQHIAEREIKDKFQEGIQELLSKGLGMAAVEGETLLGFMVPYGPIEEYFGRDNGLYVPYYAHGAVWDKRLSIYSKLYREAATSWYEKGLYSHGITIDAYDEELIRMWVVNGFGMRCMDAMQKLNNMKVATAKASEVSFRKIDKQDSSYIDNMTKIHEMQGALVKHLTLSPVFFPVRNAPLDKFLEKYKSDEAEFFVVEKEAQIIGYIKITEYGETILSGAEAIVNITGAYLEPKYRGLGIFQQLLQQVVDYYTEKGKTHLGVDCETTNPEAYGFWSKHFEPYTYSMWRRVDERHAE